MTWAVVAFLSVVIIALWQLFTCVVPAMRIALISENVLNLEKCVLKLDTYALQNGKIRHGTFIYDRFYRFLLSMLRPENIRFPKISEFDHDQKSQQRMSVIDNEINSLDIEIKECVLNAMSSISKILFLKYPVEFIKVFFRIDMILPGHNGRMIISGKQVMASSMG
jgi:hypothetical protein